ncbi:MAG TPA: helix-hairpin-helix domain-containing protein [Longimicrobium sp.]|jgi:nucleoid-associated protein YgaU
MAKTKAADETQAPRARAGAKATESKGAPAPADPPEVKAAATSPRARKAAAEKGAAGKVGSALAPAKRAPKRKVPHSVAARTADLRADLRDFASARPEGWGHDDWVGFLEHLRGRGHDTSDADAIGLQLERERLAVVLERVQGMGPRRVQAVVERFDTYWSLARADVDQIAAVPGMNLALAEKVRQAVR